MLIYYVTSDVQYIGHQIFHVSLLSVKTPEDRVRQKNYFYVGFHQLAVTAITSQVGFQSESMVSSTYDIISPYLHTLQHDI